MKLFTPFNTRSTEAEADTRSFAVEVRRYIRLAIGAITLLWLLMVIFRPSLANVWTTFYLPTLVAMFVGQWLNTRGETKSTVIVLLASGWTVLTMITLLYSKVVPPDNNRYMILVVVAGLLLGKRAGVITATVCGITEILFAALVARGVVVSLDPGAVIYTLLPHLFFLYLATLIPLLATRRVRMALKVAEEEREERRRTAEMSAVNEARFLAIVDGSPDAIMIHRNGKFIHLNPSSLELIRADSADNLLGKSILEIVHPSSSELVATALETIENTGTSSRIREGKMMRLDGSIATVETASMPVTLEGKPAIQTIAKDVTELRNLQNQMHLQVAALNSAANGIVITNREGEIVWANPAFEALTGYKSSEIIGNSPGEIVKSGKQKASFYREMWDTILSGRVWHGELVNHRKDGTLYDEMMTITPVANRDNIITHFVAVKEDVTSRKMLEQQLLQSQKLEGIGQLAGGVAHDYNNILNVVVGYAELLRRKLRDDDFARQHIESILGAARRGADLARQLLAFARKEILSPRTISVNTAVDSVRNMLQRIIGENLKLVFVPGKGLWNVKIDPTQFDQILINLVANARDAIREVGTVTIITENMKVVQNIPNISPDLEPGEYVRITVEDDGKGMDEQTLKRIFEPFFTTKPKEHGAGLGLSTVYGIVKQNGGAISVESELDKGTRIVFFLPRSVGEAFPQDEEGIDESLRGSETVLVVEDEADLLHLAKATLEEYGYNVITSLDPGDAELLSDAYGGEINLLLTDVVMPKMSGMELSERLSMKRPGLKTIFMSGYSSEGFVSAGGDLQAAEVIQKPFTLIELARKVRESLSLKTAV